MDKLTERQKKIFEFMRKEAEEKGYPPTVREICSAIGIKSTSTVHKDILALEKNGYLKKDPAKPRALMLCQNEPFNFELDNHKGSHSTSSASHDYSSPSSNSETIDIPVVGNIAAGSPIIADQNVEDSFPVPSRFVKNSGDFMLKVRGESMIEAGILDGDYILVEQHNTAKNGEMVVAMINDYESEATVKTFYKENGHFRLQPENSSMEPIIVNDVTILGKVVGVFRYFN